MGTRLHPSFHSTWGIGPNTDKETQRNKTQNSSELHLSLACLTTSQRWPRHIPFWPLLIQNLAPPTKAVFIKQSHNHLSHYEVYNKLDIIQCPTTYTFTTHEYIHDNCITYNSGNTASCHNSLSIPSLLPNLQHLQREVKPYESYRLNKGAMYK